MVVSVTHLDRIGVVVADLDAAKSHYERIYGISTWAEAEHAPADAVCHGRRTQRTPGTWRSAIGTTTPRVGENGPGGEPAYPVTFELIQPTGGESPFNEQLLSKGEGIAFIRVGIKCDANGGECDAAVDQHFADLGVCAAYSATVDGERRTFWDTRSRLGGFLVEMAPAAAGAYVPADVHGEEGAASASAPQPVQGIYHFGVLVDDVMAALPHYRDIFGIQTFDMKTWETGFGRLDDPQYRGVRGEEAAVGYFTAQGFVANFAFEIISMKYGSCHYNREFFDDRGPGIHHIFAWMTTEDAAWDKVVADMTDAGHPLVMGSPLRGGAAEFGYFDTFDALGGYLIEVVIRRFPAEPQYMAPDWIVDFAELETQKGLKNSEESEAAR